MKVDEGLIVAITSNIHVKVELDRNPETKAIQLKTIFDLKAPNVSNDKKNFTWEPTSEEISFLFQAFNVFPSSSQKQTFKVTEEPEKNKHVETTDKASSELEEIPDKEEQREPFEEEVTPNEETPSSETESDKSDESEDDEFDKKPQDRVLIAADAKTIDEIVKRKRGNGDVTFKEANDDSILDKILRQKKKGEL